MASDERFTFNPKYRTDKFETGLMAIYTKQFEAIRNQPLRMLEIGVGLGGATAFFADYFSHVDTRIFGIDIFLPDLRKRHMHHVESGRIEFIKCDQMDTEKLLHIAEAHGPFDIIIDDGAHRLAETKNCFEHLQPFIKKGGYYIIEDFNAQFMGKEYKGILPYVMGLARKAAAMKMLNYTIHSSFRCSTAIFRSNI